MKTTSVFLEMIRLLILLFLIAGIGFTAVNGVFRSFGIDVAETPGGTALSLSMLILYFVLYRNKLQFTGYYQGKGRMKLKRPITLLLVSTSIFLIVLAPFLH
ncbi:UNVERIFIED_CONTAM: hypothetical protein N8J90_01200 [Halobacillus marinus]|uniref:hypothetical protein n=1 Tax=Bacillus sp. SB49 TaxID=1071080 RepID=UPI00047D4794|nr:hypothetical protein [Bacillus sp. SB49]QHT46385.1 hypothetical protein M662_07735 [Bacillus sp. SB49]